MKPPEVNPYEAPQEVDTVVVLSENEGELPGRLFEAFAKGKEWAGFTATVTMVVGCMGGLASLIGLFASLSSMGAGPARWKPTLLVALVFAMNFTLIYAANQLLQFCNEASNAVATRRSSNILEGLRLQRRCFTCLGIGLLLNLTVFGVVAARTAFRLFG